MFRKVYIILLLNIVLANEINYYSIEYSLNSYWKLLPNITDPFDDKDLFYYTLSDANDENSVLLDQPTISHAYRKNRKTKSIKKLKKFGLKNEVGVIEGTYIIYNQHHDNNITIPVAVDLNWYVTKAFRYNQQDKFNKKIIKKFTSKKNQNNISDASLKLINQNIVGTNISLDLRGDITVNGEVVFEDKDLIALNSNQNKSWDIDIEQTQRFDIEGKIGEKLILNAQQDSEADFSWENDLTIKWEGNKNDILQSAEAGNISLSLPSTQFVSVGSGKSEGLFGLKTVHQLGPLEIQSIISREQVKKSAKSFSGGQTSEWSYINDYNFIKDRYFFIENRFKDKYYPLKQSGGALTHEFSQTQIIYDYEIYKKSITSNNDGVLDVVYGTAYINPLDSSSTQISGNWKKLIEGVDYEINRLLGYVRLNTISSQDAVAMVYNYGDYDVTTGNFLGGDQCLDENYDGITDNCDGDGDGIFNELDEDYIEGNLYEGFQIPYDSNGTDVDLIYDECLDENYDGTSDECDGDGDGVLNEEGEDYIENNNNDGFQAQEPKPINLKLIKLDSPTTPNQETWELMFKNVYSLGGSISDLNSLELDVVYNNGGLEETHSQVNNFQSFLTIFGLDTKNSNGEEIIDGSGNFYLGDGKVDHNTVLIKPNYGELFLPAHLPFAYDSNPRSDYSYIGNEYNYWDFDDTNAYWGIHSSDLEYYLDTELNDSDNDFSTNDSGPAMYYSVDNQEIISEHEFMIKYKHSSGNSTINLGFMIVEGSETVTLNGIVLSRGVDYTIDYFSGTLNLLNPDAMLPGADINITYEENELISFDQKLLFGTHLKYGFDSQNFISGGLFFYNQTIMDDNVEIGYEPMRNFIWNINGKYHKDLEGLTEFINKLPLINVTQESKINLEGEFAEVYPNPNPLGQGFLDDFEASKRSVSLSLTAKNWKSSSSPIDSLGISKPIETKKSMVWYNPYNEEKTSEIWPDIETSSQAGNTYTKTLWLRPFFENDNELYQSNDLWNGITSPLYSSDYDLGRKKYLEIWLNVENFSDDDSMSLHIDIGHLSEDINQDNILNTEDIDVYGNGWGDNNLSDEEDIGIDLCPDLYEDGLGGCNCNYRDNECSVEDENPNYSSDPNQDNWCYNNSDCSDINYYKQYNGTEGNADLGRYPDTEDLDKDYNLDIVNNYFTTTINPLGTDYVDYIPSTNWKLFRILLNDFEQRGDGTATWSDVRHVRLWVDDMNTEYNYENSIDEMNNPKVIKIAKFEIVGNEWLELGSTEINEIPSIDDDEFIEEPYFTVAVLNTHDNPNEYEPPNEQVEGEIDELTGIRMKEQSLVLSFEKPDDDASQEGGIQSDQGVAIKKSFSVLPNDKKNSFFAYKNLNMYVYGNPDYGFGGSWNQNDSSQVQLLFRFGKDEQYYEIRQSIYEEWDDRNHIDLNIKELTNYKLDISLEEYEDVGLDGCNSLVETGFGTCLDTLSFSYYCEVEPNFDFINEDRCNDYLNYPYNFDPNRDNFISEPTDDFHPDDDNYTQTEDNNKYDSICSNNSYNTQFDCEESGFEWISEPFTDLNGDGRFNIPPAYDSEHNLWKWVNGETLVTDDGNEINIDLESLCNNCSELSIKGEPSINNIEFILVSILNPTDQTIYGSVWLDELRMTGVKKEKGQAFRLKGSIDFSDLLSISSSFEQKDGDFHLLQERLGTGDNKQSILFSAKLSSGKFFPSNWGIKIPLNFNYLYDISSPKFYPGTDILAGDLNVAPDEIKTINEKVSLSGSFNKTSKSDNWFVKNTIDKISLNFSFIDRYKSTSTIEKEIAQDITLGSKYSYNFSDRNFLQPFKSFEFLPIIGKQISETRFYWSPEQISTSINLSEHNQLSTQRTGSITPTYSFNLDREYSTTYRLTKSIKFSYQKNINSNFDDLVDLNEESLNSYIPDAIKNLSIGLVKKKNEGFNINFSPDFMKWLNPNLKYQAAYSWVLSNSQASDSLNSANIGANGVLTSSIGFSPSDLIELYYVPENKKKSKNRRGRNLDKNKEVKEINNPVLKSIFENLHIFSEKFSKINVSYTYKVTNAHANVLTGLEYSPSYLYRLGLSDSPDISFNNNNDIVNSFYHQYINDFRISTNVSLTKKIQASIDYKNNRTLTNQSTTDITENLSNTYFPLGIRGNEGFPIFNWNINWAGLEKLPILDNFFRSVSIQHTFNGDNTESYKDYEIQTWQYTRNFSPLVGFTAKTIHKNPITLRANFVRNLYISNSGTSTEQKHTTQLNGRIDYSRSGGLTIPIFFFRDFNINNDVNFGFDMTFDQSETLMTTILIDDPEDFNQQDLSTSLSLKPRIGYSFTKYITGDVYFNYIFTENKTTGSKKERDFGFNVRIKIQG